MTTINIKLPDDLHKSLKIIAAQKDINLKDFIISILREKTNKGDVNEGPVDSAT